MNETVQQHTCIEIATIFADWPPAMRVPAKPDDIIEIYADESSQNKHRHLVLGAIVVSMLDTPDLIEAIKKARLPELPQGEARWAKISRAKLSAYKRMVDVVFDNQDKWHFYAKLTLDSALASRQHRPRYRRCGGRRRCILC